MNRLNSIFEEDIEMQDMIENLDGITDDSEELIFKVIEDRAAANEKPHLFVNDVIDAEAKENISKLIEEDRYDFDKDEDDNEFDDDDFLDDDGDDLF